MAKNSFLSLRGINKSFGATQVLKDINLDIGQGSFFTLLGPSGCGKTTLLRLIAGFDVPDNGALLLEGKRLDQLPAAQRPINTVFQNYALFPHLSVGRNIAFGLERLKWDKKTIAQRVDEMVALVRMTDFVNRTPAQLSGGQQQRVALARAIAPSPKILLLDEPLSALDLKLRQAMRLELKRIQKEVDITFIFVTHDQEEALSMSDRVAVMEKGVVLQVDSPLQIYQEPANLFVADFIGSANIVKGIIKDKKWLMPNGQSFAVKGANKKGEAFLCFRPEDTKIEKTNNKKDFMVEDIDYMGNLVNVILSHPVAGKVKASVATDKMAGITVGHYYRLMIDHKKSRLLFS